MPVLVTNNFDDDSIKNERASMETPFFHYRSMGFFRRSKAANSVVSGPIWPKFELVRETMENRWRHHFPHYKSVGDFCCHGKQSFDLICPKTLCSLVPTPKMLHIQFDQDWPTGISAIQVWKCGQRTTDDGRTMGHWYTISSPCKPSAQVS